MKQYISFVKRKALIITPFGISNGTENYVHQFNHELMKYGYILTKEAFDTLSTQTVDKIQEVFNDVVTGIKEVVGDGGYVATYPNFPQSVLALSYQDFWINAILFYWTNGAWKPEDAAAVKRDFKIEAKNYKKVGLITESEFATIFTDLLYSGSSVSAFDKRILNWFIDNNFKFDFNKITFKETAAYVGKRLFSNAGLTVLPTKEATSVLRIWSAFSNGDEGLKENTKFKNPNSAQRRILLNTLNNCYDLEESFKIYREKWLKVLFYLNPLTIKNSNKYPEVYRYANLIRNAPEQLRTFNSRVEELIAKKDEAIFDLLKTRKGIFMRKLDHTVRLFGLLAVNKWLETNPKIDQLITVYNHFTDRDKASEGRGAVLASATSSSVVNYAALEPLPEKLVAHIKNTLLDKIKSLKNQDLKHKKVFINRALYYRPLAVNNRASSLSLDGKVNGTVELAPKGKTLRMYVGWEDRSDIDLSAFVIQKDNSVIKVGWNSYAYDTKSGGVVYSGDNTGNYDKNAEYMDVTPSQLSAQTEWVIVQANIFRGHNGFNGYKGKCRAGWMEVAHPESNRHWQPDTIEHSVVLSSTAKTAYVMAYHAPTGSVVYLDLALGNSNVSTTDDGLKMKMYLQKLITLDTGETEISWDKINQGHVINALSGSIVDDQTEADLVFDENSTWESIAKYLV